MKESLETKTTKKAIKVKTSELLNLINNLHSVHILDRKGNVVPGVEESMALISHYLNIIDLAVNGILSAEYQD